MSCRIKMVIKGHQVRCSLSRIPTLRDNNPRGRKLSLVGIRFFLDPPPPPPIPHVRFSPYFESHDSNLSYFDAPVIRIGLITYALLAWIFQFQEESNPDRYLKWANGFLVVYSITSQDSFEAARRYLESITKYLRITGKDRAISLVGNKLDLERYR